MKHAMLLLLLANLSYQPIVKAQLKPDSQKCNCRYNFDFLSKGVEDNYVGFTEKLGKGGLAAYKKFRDSLANIADSKRDFECYLLLTQYINWFQDPHLTVGVSDAADAPIEEMRRIYGKFPRVKIDEQQLWKRFESDDLDSVEGIWQLRYPATTVAIYKDSADKFIGVVLRADSVVWFPGQVKMEIKKHKGKYQLKYFMYDHTQAPNPSFSFANNNNILMLNGFPWTKRSGSNAAKPFKEELIGLKQLSNKTAYLKIKTSMHMYKAQLDSIVGANLEALRNTENLIIDIRHNNGGVSMLYDTLMSMIYTHPFRTYGLLLKSSDENIALYKESLDDPYVSKNLKEQFKKYIALMEQHKGERVQVTHGREVILGPPLPKPRQVAIIMNRKSVSAAEYFIRIAKNSSKVKLFGENSRGGLDHTEVGRLRILPCGYLTYMCPMGMSEEALTHTIDNVGYPPDVRIPEENKDWIGFTQKYLESEKKP